MSRRLLIGALVPALVAPAALLTVARADAPGPLDTTCAEVTSTDGVAYQRCTGELPSFDGVGLDTDLSLPASWQPGDGPLPTVVMLHGWSNDKAEWQSDSKDADGKDKYHWNNVWFVSQGWAVVNYTARGFKESCGIRDTDPNCVTTGTHLADRRFETRDSQTLLGELVDAGVADPQRLAATGGSYGGGQTWLLATSVPWTSAKGTRLQLAGAVAKYPWTDLLYSLTPNGRATDAPYRAGDEARHEKPFGVMKASYVGGLYAVGRATGEGRYDPVDGLPDSPASNIDAQFARVGAGEPYDDPVVDLFVQDFRNRSPYQSTQPYLDAITAGAAAEVPVMSIQGWTDPLFPAVETVQMFRKLKAFDADYPVDIAFGDVGHDNARNPAYQWQYLNTQANQFLNTHVLGQGQGRPTEHSLAFVTTCDPDATTPAYQGTGWDDLHPGALTATAADSRTTTSVPTSQTSLNTDPITHPGCQTAPAGDADTSWTWQVPSGGFTLVGMPELRVGYALAGADATPAFYLWDVAPDGTRTLVTRGLWRLSVPAGDAAGGELAVKLFGNGWRFEPGHQVQLQVTQTDAPYLRPDNLPSQITWTGPRLTLPTHEARTGELAAG